MVRMTLVQDYLLINVSLFSLPSLMNWISVKILFRYIEENRLLFNATPEEMHSLRCSNVNSRTLVE